MQYSLFSISHSLKACSFVVFFWDGVLGFVCFGGGFLGCFLLWWCGGLLGFWWWILVRFWVGLGFFFLRERVWVKRYSLLQLFSSDLPWSSGCPRLVLNHTFCFLQYFKENRHDCKA